jgi:hypothetical protein
VDGGTYTVDGDVYDLGSAGVEIAVVEPCLKASPNPFTSTTNFFFEIPAEGPVSLGVYDVRGRLVRLFSGLEAGEGTVTWRGTSAGGSVVSPGVYFIRVEGTSGGVSYKLVKR